MKLSFYTRNHETDNGKFVTSIVLHSNVDKAFNLVCKLVLGAMFKNHETNFKCVENHVFDADSNLAKQYFCKVTFRHNSLTH